MTFAMPSPGPASEVRVVELSRPPGALWEQGLVALWFLVTFIPFPRDELLLYPLALAFAGCVALRYRQMIPSALRCWPLLLIPGLTAFSMFWSPVPSQALRLGIMMILTLAIALYISVRLTPRQIIRSAFAACAVSVFIALPELNSLDDEVGLYPQKNIFANRMMLAMVMATGIALDRGQPVLLRLAAAPFIPLTLFMIVRAQSATALLLATGSLLVLAIVWLFWSKLSRIRHLRTFVVTVLAALGLTGLLLFFNLPNNSLVQDVLFALGKDATLTGRTELWEAAERISAERPWLGVGAEGFWQPWVGEAETILDWSYKRPGSKFSFHSAYYEVLVHLGLVGLAFIIVQVGWVTLNAALGWVRRQAMPQSVLLVIAATTVATTFTESTLYGVFNLGVILFYVTGISAISEKQRKSRVLVAMPPSAGAPAGVYAE